MLRLILVGNDVEPLKEYFDSKGTVEVSHAFTSIEGSLTKIHSEIIQSDVLVYIHQANTGQLRKDLNLLSELLKNNNFFTIKEFVLLHNRTEDSDYLEKLQKIAMDSAGFKNYRVKLISGAMSYVAIYDTVLGIRRNANDLGLSYREIYLAERGDTSKVVYDEDNSKQLFENFGYESISQYENRKKAAISLSGGSLIQDGTEDQRKSYDNVELGSAYVPTKKMQSKLMVVTGSLLNGRSTYATALAVSAALDGKRTVVLDFTKHCNTVHNMQRSKMDFSKKDIYSVISQGHLSNELLTVIPCKTLAGTPIIAGVLTILQTAGTIFADAIIAVVDEGDTSFLSDSLLVVDTMIYVTPPMLGVIYSAAEIFDTFIKSACVCMLNRNLQLPADEVFSSAPEIKDQLQKRVHVVEPIWFENFDRVRNLYNMIGGLHNESSTVA